MLLGNCESMLIVFISIPFYTNRIVMNFVLRAASGALVPTLGASPHIPSVESVYWCQYYFVIQVLSRQLYFIFLIYTCYPTGVVLYYICLKAEMCPLMKGFFVNIACVGIY